MGTQKSEQDEIYDGIFDIEQGEITSPSSGAQRNPDFYQPSLSNKNVKKNGPGGSPEYSSRIRFCPDFKHKLHKVSKFVYYLQDPNDAQKKFFVDCLSNLKGDPRGSNNIITNAYMEMKKTESATLRAIAKEYFNRKLFFWSLVYVILDAQEPEAEGKIKIFKFGKQVDEMIEWQGKEDVTTKKSGVVVFKPFAGKDFFLNISEKLVEREGKSSKQTSYEKSEFDDKITGFTFDKCDTRLDDTAENRKLVLDFCLNNSPSMEQVVAKNWTPTDEQKIIESVRITIADSAVFDKIYRKTYGGGKASTYHPKADSKPEEQKSSTTKPAENKTETVIPENTAQVGDAGSKVEEPVIHEVSSTVEEFDNIESFDFQEK